MQTFRPSIKGYQRHVISELVVILLLGLVSVIITSVFRVNEYFVDFAHVHQLWRIDDLPITLAIFACGAGIYAVRRWREITQTMAQRVHMEAALQEREDVYRALVCATQRQTQELELLNQVRSVLARELDLSIACHKIVEAIAATFGYTHVSLYLLHDNTLHLQHQVGYDQVIAHVPVTDGISGRVVRSGQPVLLTDVRGDPAFLGAIDGITAEICVPLFDDHQVAGILNVESTQVGGLSSADLQLMVALGEHVGPALERARLYQEARESEERFRRLSGATLEGIVVHDQGLILDANATFAAMFGQSAADISGKNAFAFMAPESHTAIREHIQARFEEPYEALGLRADGTTFPIELQGRVIPYQGRSVRVTAVRDITARKRADDELQNRLRETLLLNRVIAAAASSLEPSAVLEIVCTELAGAFDLPQAAAALLDTDQTQLTVVAEYCAAGRPSALGVVIPVADNLATHYVLTQRAPLVILNAQTDARQAVIHELEQQRGTISLLIVPLLIRDQVVGTIGLDALTYREFSPAEIALAENVASAASRALENAYLYAAVQQELTERHQTQQALYRERDFIAAVLDTVGALVVVLDRDGRIVRFNRACEQVTGYTSDEMAGRTLWDTVLLPEEVARVKDTFDRLCAKEHPSPSENHWVTRNGARRLIAWNNSVLIDGSGDVAYVIRTGIDITERRQAEETLRTNEERFQLVVRATNDAIWDHDLNTQTVWWNDHLQALFGYDAESVAPTFEWWCQRIHLTDQARVVASYQAALAKGAEFWSDEYRFQRANGTYADVFDRAYVVYDRDRIPVRMIGAMMDMSQRKQVERLKNEFVATVSHELRTPMTSIRGALSLVANGVVGPLPPQAQSMINIACKNSERLISLINDILDIEKIESGQMTFRLAPYNLLRLVEQALEATNAYARQFQVAYALARCSQMFRCMSMTIA